MRGRRVAGLGRHLERAGRRGPGEARRPVERDRAGRPDVAAQVEPERPVVLAAGAHDERDRAELDDAAQGRLRGLLRGDLDAVDQRPVGRAEVEHRAGAVLVELELAVRARDRLVVDDDRVGGVAPDRPAAGADVDGPPRVRAGEDRERQRRPRPRPGPVRRQLQDGALVQAGIQRAGGGVHHAPVDRDRLGHVDAQRGVQHVVQRGLGLRRPTTSSRSVSCWRRTTCIGLGFPAMKGGGPAVDALNPGTVLDGRYRIEEEIARGGMGVIYRAIHVTLDLPRAVKLITPQFARDHRYLERFQVEATAAARIEHPNVVTVHDFGEVDGAPYLVMQYVEGVDLRTAGRARGPADAAARAGPAGSDRGRVGRGPCDGGRAPGRQAEQHPSRRRAGAPC